MTNFPTSRKISLVLNALQTTSSPSVSSIPDCYKRSDNRDLCSSWGDDFFVADNVGLFGFNSRIDQKIFCWRFCSPEMVKQADSEESLLVDDNTKLARVAPELNYDKIKGAVVLVHGIGQHGRLEALQYSDFSESFSVKQLNDLDPKHPFDPETLETLSQAVRSTTIRLVFDHSLAQFYCSNGFVVYAIDLVGHGISDSCDGQLGGIVSVDDLAKDVAELVFRLRMSGEVPRNLPMFIQGVSMGGLIIFKVLKFSSMFRYPEDNALMINGAVMVSPAFCMDKTENKFPNYILRHIGGVMASNFPHSRIVALTPCTKYPFYSLCNKQDRFCVGTRVPTKMAWLVRLAAKSCPTEVCELVDVPMLFVHSTEDTLVDYEGSERIFGLLNDVEDKQLLTVDGMWHNLTKEPGCSQIRVNILDWYNKRIFGQKIEDDIYNCSGS